MSRQHQSGAQQRGLSLVELLVSLAIGVFLMGGALKVYIDSRAVYTLNETLARMQENAGFAIKQLESDIQLAGFWGTHSQVGEIIGREQRNPIALAVGNECDPNWSIRMREYLVGSNNLRPAWACLSNAAYQPDTDILTVRRAAASPVANANIRAGALYVRSSTAPRSQLFVGGTPIPAGMGPTAQNFQVIARAYYIRPWSIGFGTNDQVPSLRRLDLTEVGGGLTVQDQEVVQGIENLQFQFGIDTNDDQAVDAYVNADSALLAPALNNSVLSVRLWILVRSEAPETGYVSNETFRMGDITVPAANDNFRRMLITRTILLRNRV